MPTVTLRRDDGALVCERCRLARTFVSRLAGLMGRRALDPYDGLLFTRTSSIHTHFMRFSIDAVFLDEENRVVRVTRELRPWRLARARGSSSVLELPGGSSARLGLAAGQTLVADAAR